MSENTEKNPMKPSMVELYVEWQKDTVIKKLLSFILSFTQAWSRNDRWCKNHMYTFFLANWFYSTAVWLNCRKTMMQDFFTHCDRVNMHNCGHARLHHKMNLDEWQITLEKIGDTVERCTMSRRRPDVPSQLSHCYMTTSHDNDDIDKEDDQTGT